MASRGLRRCAIAATVAVLTACGGSPNTPNGSLIGSPGSPAPPPTRLVNVHLTVTIPAGSNRHVLHPDYLSADTQSLAILLASVNGQGVSGANAATVDTAPASPHCHAQAGKIVCTATIAGAAGNDVFTVTTYAGLNATGAVLSVGTVSAAIGKDGGGLGISDSLSLSLAGVIASLELTLSPKEGRRGQPVTSAVTLTAFDAAGARIVGGSDFQSPISLSVQGDPVGSFRLHSAGRSGPSLSIAKPVSDITLAYDGNKQASSVTVAAAVSGSQPASANAPFALRGQRPPPPVGTIYALNAGTNGGLAATVTEYDGHANGDAAPIRTLQLNSKLYARSINVDAAGNLYVGYLDSSLGFSPSNGAPDAKNLVAVYAPRASGNDRPTATLAGDPKTHTALFPLYASVDAAGRFVTYGATAVDGNSGDAVLTYAAGSSGPAAPLHGWDFATPSIAYAGPTGLSLDAAGNFYVAGALKSALGSTYGLFVAAAADIGNPSANPARTIPWDPTTQLTPGQTTNVALDSSGEVFIANSLLQEHGSSVACQGRANVYAAGATGGITDVPPLRVAVMQGVFTRNSACASPRSSLAPFFPTLALYGPTVFVADDFNNAIAAYPSNRGGIVIPTLHIAGSATGLNAPIAVVVSSLSGHAPAWPVAGRPQAPVSTRILSPAPHHP
ncbi:MAG: hypothetical protein ABI231_02925 [Candidatus Tumulicola sp.]